MKIRDGFVSNSSSTSFCLVGISSWDENVKNKNIKLQDIFESKIGEEKLKDFKFYCNSDVYDNGEGYLGKPITKMRDEETLGQFKESTKKELIEAIPELGDIAVGLMIDGWYNG